MNHKQQILLGVFTGSLHCVLIILLSGGFTPTNIKSGIAQGLLFGIGFGWGFPYIMKRLGKRIEKNIHMELLTDESIIYKGGANLFRGIEGVGGKLFLTNLRLHFQPHKFNIQNNEVSIALDQIDEVATYKTGKLITFNNGLKVTTLDGTEFRFVANKRDEWIDQLVAIGSIEG
ncbi:MAG: GRAM domain-containing protein [Flammeovirgaceae bacterium]